MFHAWGKLHENEINWADGGEKLNLKGFSFSKLFCHRNYI